MQDNNKTQISAINSQTPLAESAMPNEGPMAVPTTSTDQVLANQTIQAQLETNPQPTISRPTPVTIEARPHAGPQAPVTSSTETETIKPVIPTTEQQGTPLVASETIKLASQPTQQTTVPPKQSAPDQKPLQSTLNSEITSGDDSPLSQLDLDSGGHISTELEDYVKATIEHNSKDPKKLGDSRSSISRAFLIRNGFDKKNI